MYGCSPLINCILLSSSVRRRPQMIGLILQHEGLIKVVIEEKVEGKICRGRLRLDYIRQIAHDMGCNSYRKVKRLAERKKQSRDESNQPKGE